MNNIVNTSGEPVKVLSTDNILSSQNLKESFFILVNPNNYWMYLEMRHHKGKTVKELADALQVTYHAANRYVSALRELGVLEIGEAKTPRGRPIRIIGNCWPVTILM